MCPAIIRGAIQKTARVDQRPGGIFPIRISEGDEGAKLMQCHKAAAVRADLKDRSVISPCARRRSIKHAARKGQTGRGRRAVRAVGERVQGGKSQAVGAERKHGAVTRGAPRFSRSIQRVSQQNQTRFRSGPVEPIGKTVEIREGAAIGLDAKNRSVSRPAAIFRRSKHGLARQDQSRQRIGAVAVRSISSTRTRWRREGVEDVQPGGALRRNRQRDKGQRGQRQKPPPADGLKESSHPRSLTYSQGCKRKKSGLMCAREKV